MSPGKTKVRFTSVRCGMTSIGVLLLGSIAHGQGMGGEPGGGPWDPLVDGQWAGPYDLVQKMTEDANGDPLNVQEIAHSAVLPPAGYDLVVPGVDPYLHAGKVLFWNRKTAGQYEPTYPTWIWDPNRPSGLAPPISVLGDAVGDPFLGDDLFCSGATFLPSGDLIAVGGYEAPSGGQGPAIAIDNAFILRVNGDGDPAWTGTPYWESSPTHLLGMQSARYYPSAVPLPEGSVLALGGIENAGRNRQVFHNAWNVGSQTFVETGFGGPEDLWTNRFIDPVSPPPDCATAELYDVEDYAKVFVLTDGRLMHVDGTTRLDPDGPGGPLPLDDYHASHFVEPFGPSGCAADPDNPRWNLGSVHVAGGPDPAIFGCGTVHLITRTNEDNTGTDITEIVYLTGGVPHGEDDQTCDLNVFPSNVVKKMLAPSELTVWDTATVPTTNKASQNHVLLILLDGSLLVVGGTQLVTNPEAPPPFQCDGAERPERYMAPEVFHDVSAVPAENPWRSLAKAAHRRDYHQTAGLLPDGRVFSAGSTYNVDHNSRYSVELFSPPYMFVGPRPEILNPPTEVQVADTTYALEVRLGSADRRLERVAILRTSAVTHAFDMNQRYVELEFVSGPFQDPADPLKYTVEIRWPTIDPDGNDVVGLPGWYMMTAVDTPASPDSSWNCGSAEPSSTLCTQRPSEAAWVQLEPQ